MSFGLESGSRRAEGLDGAGTGHRAGRRPGHLSRRLSGLLAIGLLLLLSVLLSVSVGSAMLDLPTVLGALFSPDGSIASVTIHEVRIPRTVLALLVGAALGIAGGLMQAMTNNPIADPGLLGINAGASFAVAVGIGLFGITSLGASVWWSMAGTVVAAVLLYLVATRGPIGATPVRLTLVGAALSAVFTGASMALTYLNPQSFDRMRFWLVGSVTDRPVGTIESVGWFVLAGLLLAIWCVRGLNALALGDDVARSLGVNVVLTRVLVLGAIVLLCGAATAAAGPIVFVGLMIPHLARRLFGPDQRWIMASSMLLAPLLLVVADLLGRFIVWPAELRVGIVTALVGAPVLIAMVRGTKKESW